MRPGNRKNDELRTIKLEPDYLDFADGSCLVECGKTRVLCTATLENRVPPFLRGTGQGWVTSEYGMLPAATQQRTRREVSRGRQSGRSMEIQRLIGRSLRAVTDMDAFPERTLWIDCDVIQADGGTRTASVTGAFVAMLMAFHRLAVDKLIERFPVKRFMAAVSVGIVRSEQLLDLCYEEDSIAEVDMNVVMTDAGRFIEIQGTAEHGAYSKTDLDGMLAMASKGIDKIFQLQRECLPFDSAMYEL